VTFTIDSMTAGDIPAVVAIEPPSKMTEAQLREELERPWARVRVARESKGPSRAQRGEQDSVAVAFLVSWHVADELHILNVATRPDRRRRGLGRALMLDALEFAKQKRLRLILLEVKRTNRPAIELYRSLRFSAMGIRPRYYPDGEDALEMVVILDPATGEIVPHADEVRFED
jgi:ribosomal-protein-alanine N-acetyltransferase